jgi:hypothetical protein
MVTCSPARPGSFPRGPAHGRSFALRRRVAYAFAVSLLLHAAVLWFPRLRLPHEPVMLPPLTARLEPLPAPPVREAAARMQPSPLALAARQDGSPARQDAAKTPVLSEMEKSAQTTPFPRHLQLVFNLYRGAEHAAAGEFTHRLEVDRDNYFFKATRQADVSSGGQTVRSSFGKIDAQGLHPLHFEEERAGRITQEATFDWAANRLSLNPGGALPLPAGALDPLSFMYQFSQMGIGTLGVEYFPVTLADGRQLVRHQVEIGLTEDIATPMGALRALHLRRIHRLGEGYFEIWLGIDYRMLPVMYREVDGEGRLIEEFVVSDIRVGS